MMKSAALLDEVATGPQLAATVQPAARAEQTRAATTRALLVGAARELFGQAGYHATGTNDVVARAAVTRGALYHHFPAKEDLFEAVYRQVADDLSAETTAATRSMEGQTWARVIASVRAYLGLLAQRPAIQRILLVDGPSVFGWARWRTLQVECRLPGWVETLRLLTEQGMIADQPREPLAHLILALMDDAALTIAHADNPEATLAEVMVAIETLLNGLRCA